LLKPLHFIERIKTFEEGVETYDPVFCGRNFIIKNMNLGGDATVNCVSWRSRYFLNVASLMSTNSIIVANFEETHLGRERILSHLTWGYL